MDIGDHIQAAGVDSFLAEMRRETLAIGTLLSNQEFDVGAFVLKAEVAAHLSLAPIYTNLTFMRDDDLNDVVPDGESTSSVRRLLATLDACRRTDLVAGNPSNNYQVYVTRSMFADALKLTFIFNVSHFAAMGENPAVVVFEVNVGPGVPSFLGSNLSPEGVSIRDQFDFFHGGCMNTPVTTLANTLWSQPRCWTTKISLQQKGVTFEAEDLFKALEGLSIPLMSDDRTFVLTGPTEELPASQKFLVRKFQSGTNALLRLKCSENTVDIQALYNLEGIDQQASSKRTIQVIRKKLDEFYNPTPVLLDPSISGWTKFRKFLGLN